ncbi:hypothetical protein G6F61_014786 [Rhizopus arrhizus]|nr:hypothetical protein G6F61_014786 [Rhizopus arrhizus]
MRCPAGWIAVMGAASASILAPAPGRIPICACPDRRAPAQPSSITMAENAGGTSEIASKAWCATTSDSARVKPGRRQRCSTLPSTTYGSAVMAAGSGSR